MKKVMDGQTFKETVIAGLGGLKSNIDAVNDLNVFPIPDGDTGENMGATLYGGVTLSPRTRVCRWAESQARFLEARSSARAAIRA